MSVSARLRRQREVSFFFKILVVPVGVVLCPVPPSLYQRYTRLQCTWFLKRSVSCEGCSGQRTDTHLREKGREMGRRWGCRPGCRAKINGLWKIWFTSWQQPPPLAVLDWSLVTANSCSYGYITICQPIEMCPPFSTKTWWIIVLLWRRGDTLKNWSKNHFVETLEFWRLAARGVSETGVLLQHLSLCVVSKKKKEQIKQCSVEIQENNMNFASCCSTDVFTFVCVSSCSYDWWENE